MFSLMSSLSRSRALVPLPWKTDSLLLAPGDFFLTASSYCNQTPPIKNYVIGGGNSSHSTFHSLHNQSPGRHYHLLQSITTRIWGTIIYSFHFESGGQCFEGCIMLPSHLLRLPNPNTSLSPAPPIAYHHLCKSTVLRCFSSDYGAFRVLDFLNSLAEPTL